MSHPSNRVVSPDGIKLIVQREGVRLSPYRDIAGNWTIGIGAIYQANGEPVTRHTGRLTNDEAIVLFRKQLKIYSDHVSREVMGAYVPQQSFDALVSICYNIGRGAFSGSTFLRELKAGDVKGSAKAMLMWDKITKNGMKVVSESLKARRKCEVIQFLQGYRKTNKAQKTVSLSGKFTGVIADD